MAIVAPFAAYRYNPLKVDALERVLTQPYDKITPQMQKDYFARSPYNLAHIIRGEVKLNDTPTHNVYTRAAGHFGSWREQGILVQRSKPAFYAYFQEFRVRGEPRAPRQVRKGFIGLGRLEDYSSGVVFRHEQTLSAPKADRLELLRATRGHFGQIFMLYSDEHRRVDQLLDEVSHCTPVVRVVDDYGTVHLLWDIDEPGQVQAIQKYMSDRKLIIADGHHRYETALNFRRECQASRPHTGNEDCAYVMMTFINMESEGIAVLPTHRLVAGVPEFTRAGFLSRAARYFSGKEYPYSSPEERTKMMQRLREDMASGWSAGQNVIGAVFQDHPSFCLLQLREEGKKTSGFAKLSPTERSLDVNVLHRIAFGLCLGMDEESVRKEKFLTYVREFDQGAEAVFQGQAQACFFLNPVRIQQVREIALGGGLLPQKSTDFYPKLLSGLTIYAVGS
ncbi:MAG: DUF1015 domain-containing protein [Acidobacteria bacterium]|nr:DUF1015 domain-containing protein [Acidobacteriota bacterium]